ncbi:MAG: hypothetical protein KBT31_00755 [Firmicutes bacterium]|nr:hypothetical protein [Candidatus Colimorpha enterica]
MPGIDEADLNYFPEIEEGKPIADYTMYGVLYRIVDYQFPPYSRNDPFFIEEIEGKQYKVFFDRNNNRVFEEMSSDKTVRTLTLDGKNYIFSFKEGENDLLTGLSIYKYESEDGLSLYTDEGGKILSVAKTAFRGTDFFDFRITEETTTEEINARLKEIFGDLIDLERFGDAQWKLTIGEESDAIGGCWLKNYHGEIPTHDCISIVVDALYGSKIRSVNFFYNYMECSGSFDDLKLSDFDADIEEELKVILCPKYNLKSYEIVGIEGIIMCKDKPYLSINVKATFDREGEEEQSHTIDLYLPVPVK